MNSAAIRGLRAAKTTIFACRQASFIPPVAAAVSLLQKCSFHLSPLSLAEPLKKKKRIDPAILKAREDRKKRKIEKAIRRLEKMAKQLKPIDEMHVSYKLKQEIPMRTRHAAPPPAEVLEARASLLKEWTRHKGEEALREKLWIERALAAQEHALAELRAESEELYQAAIQIDSDLVPYTAVGVVESLPPDDYDPPDGEYRDVTKKWT